MRGLACAVLFLLCSASVVECSDGGDEAKPTVLDDIKREEEQDGDLYAVSEENLTRLKTNNEILSRRQKTVDSEVLKGEVNRIPSFHMMKEMTSWYNQFGELMTRATPAEMYVGYMRVLSRLVSKINGRGESTVPYHNTSFFGKKKRYSWDVELDFLKSLGYYATIDSLDEMTRFGQWDRLFIEMTDIYIEKMNEREKTATACAVLRKLDVNIEELCKEKEGSNVKEMPSFCRCRDSRDAKVSKKYKKIFAALSPKVLLNYWSQYGMEKPPTKEERTAHGVDSLRRYRDLCAENPVMLENEKNVLMNTYGNLLKSFTFHQDKDICDFAWLMIDFGMSTTCLQRRMKMPCFAMPRENADRPNSIDSYVHFAPFCPAHVIASDMAYTREFAWVAYPPVQECEGQSGHILHDIYRILKETDKNGNMVYCSRFKELAMITRHPTLLYQHAVCTSLMEVLAGSGHLVPNSKCSVSRPEECLAKDCCVLSECTRSVKDKLKEFYEEEAKTATPGDGEPFDPYWQLTLNLVSKMEGCKRGDGRVNERNLHRLVQKDRTLKLEGLKKDDAPVTVNCKPLNTGKVQVQAKEYESSFVFPDFDTLQRYFELRSELSDKHCIEDIPPEHGLYSGSLTFTVNSAKKNVGSRPVKNHKIADTLSLSSSFNPASSHNSFVSTKSAAGEDFGFGMMMDEVTKKHEDDGDKFARKEMGALAVTPLDM